MCRENFAVNEIDAGTAIERWKSDGQRRLGKSVNRQLRFAAESIFRKALLETIERLRIDRLRAIQCGTPGAEVDSLNIFLGDFSYAKFVRKIRSSGNRSAVFVKSVQPSLRACEERQRRHNANRRTEMQRREPRADQAHVVIQRKPADADVLRCQLHGFADRAHVGQQICVREHHALRIAGRS